MRSWSPSVSCGLVGLNSLLCTAKCSVGKSTIILLQAMNPPLVGVLAGAALGLTPLAPLLFPTSSAARAEAAARLPLELNLSLGAQPNPHHGQACAGSFCSGVDPGGWIWGSEVYSQIRGVLYFPIWAIPGRPANADRDRFGTYCSSHPCVQDLGPYAKCRLPSLNSCCCRCQDPQKPLERFELANGSTAGEHTCSPLKVCT